MNALLKSIAAAAALSLASVGGANAQDAEEDVSSKFQLPADYYEGCPLRDTEEFAAVEDQVTTFTDMRLMAAAINDPEKLFALASAINDPDTVNILLTCGMEPVVWDMWMANGTDPEVWAEAMVAMLNADGLVKWAMAPVNGDLWRSAASHLDAGRYVKWVKAMGDAEFYTPVTAMLTLDWYGPRLEWMLNPASYAPMLQVFGFEVG